MSDRIRRRAWPLTVSALAIGLVVTGFYGFTKTESLGAAERDLVAARATIAERDAGLATAESLASTVQASLDSTTAALKSQEACSAALHKYSTDLDALNLTNTDRYNALAKGSAYSKAADAMTAALIDVAENYRLSLVDVLNANYSRALKYLKQAKAAQKDADKAAGTVSAAIDVANDETTASDVRRGILNDQWIRAQATCGFTQTSPGVSG